MTSPGAHVRPAEPAKRALGRRRLPPGAAEQGGDRPQRHGLPARRGRRGRAAGRSAPPLPPARVAASSRPTAARNCCLSAVRSALAQTVSDLVVLVVDDGGGLPELPDDPRLRACSLSVNSKVLGVVLNVGIRLTRSTYVAFLDDDNEWEPDHLEVAIGALEAGQPGERPGLVYTALRRSFPDGRLLDVLSIPFHRRRLAHEGFVDTNSLVIKRFPGLHFSRIRRPRRTPAAGGLGAGLPAQPSPACRRNMCRFRRCVTRSTRIATGRTGREYSLPELLPFGVPPMCNSADV